jgi:hypothetical protein
MRRLEVFLGHPPDVPGAEGRYLLSVCDEKKCVGS